MTAPRPTCVHCGARYGARATTCETVRWDTPSEQVTGPRGLPGYVQRKGSTPAPAPPYRGNGIVVQESSPYVSADDGRAVMYRYLWDGESYHGGYKPFCTLRCALDYARKAYQRSQK